MKKTTGWFIVAALGAAALLTVDAERGGAQTVPPGEIGIQTGCAAVDPTTVEGFVSNPGPDLVQIDGDVRFSFTVSNAMSRPTIQVHGSGVVPSGRTVTVARTRLAWTLLPHEVCRLDISGAVR